MNHEKHEKHENWAGRSRKKVEQPMDMQSPAGADLQRMLDLEADQPSGQFEMAMFCLSRQQPTEA